MVAHAHDISAPAGRINLFANTQRALPGYLTERKLRQGQTPLWIYPDRKPEEQPETKKQDEQK